MPKIFKSKWLDWTPPDQESPCDSGNISNREADKTDKGPSVSSGSSLTGAVPADLDDGSSEPSIPDRFRGGNWWVVTAKDGDLRLFEPYLGSDLDFLGEIAEEWNATMLEVPNRDDPARLDIWCQLKNQDGTVKSWFVETRFPRRARKNCAEGDSNGISIRD